LFAFWVCASCFQTHQNFFLGSRQMLTMPPSTERRNIQVSMVFDFIKKRASEGVSQVSNIAEKAAKGKLGEALSDTGKYIEERQKEDAENFQKFTEGLEKSRKALLGNLNALFGLTDLKVEETLEQLEEILMMSDIGVTTTTEILDDVRQTAVEDKLDSEVIKTILRGKLIEVLEGKDGKEGRQLRQSSKEGSPTVIMMIGANGMGKTTTVGKMAARFKEGGLKVLVGACDTFRAAAVDQLDEWANRAGVDIVKPTSENSKAQTVVFDTVSKGIEGNYDVVILDTSGRLSNNRGLNEQLIKMYDAAKNRLGRKPDEVLLVVDAAVGRNAVDQAKRWKEDVRVSGLVVTKLDGTAKGGFTVSVVRDLGVPIKLIGVGEKIEDLRDFEPTPFVDALLGFSEEESKELQANLDVINAERAIEEEQRRIEEAEKAAEFNKRALEMVSAGPPRGPSGNPRLSRKAKKKRGKR